MGGYRIDREMTEFGSHVREWVSEGVGPPVLPSMSIRHQN